MSIKDYITMKYRPTNDTCCYSGGYSNFNRPHSQGAMFDSSITKLKYNFSTEAVFHPSLSEKGLITSYQANRVYMTAGSTKIKVLDIRGGAVKYAIHDTTTEKWMPVVAFLNMMTRTESRSPKYKIGDRVSCKTNNNFTISGTVEAVGDYNSYYSYKIRTDLGSEGFWRKEEELTKLIPIAQTKEELEKNDRGFFQELANMYKNIGIA